MQSVTANEIAAIIRQPDETIQVAIDRVSNWTKEGLLIPAGEKHPGRGRKRQYEHSSLFDAVLIQTLTDSIGMPAVSIIPIIKEARKRYNKPTRDTGQFLIASRRKRGSPWSVLSMNAKQICELFQSNVQNRTYIIVDMSRNIAT